MEQPSVGVWLTSGSGKPYRLSRQPDLKPGPGLVQAQSTKETVLHVDPSTTRQSILGIGSSLEEAAVTNA